MSLLAEQGKQRARDDWRESCPTWDEEHHLLIAQRTLTLKAVAEWLGEYCGYHLNLTERPVDSPPKRRHMCGFCRENLLEALREGKMPGETE